MMLLDTHVLLWLRVGERRLGARARHAIEVAWRAGEVCVSSISFWEIAMLQQRGRIRLHGEVEPWRRTQLQEGMVEIPIDGPIGIRAAGLAGFHEGFESAAWAERHVFLRIRNSQAAPCHKPRGAR